jgi:hypothetical protein
MQILSSHIFSKLIAKKSKSLFVIFRSHTLSRKERHTLLKYTPSPPNDTKKIMRFLLATAVSILGCFSYLYDVRYCFNSSFSSARAKSRDVTTLADSAVSNHTLHTHNDTHPSCILPKPVSWEWNYYSQLNSTNDDDNAANYTTPIKDKNVLIALFSGFDNYARMLELTAPINKAYARKWRQDLVVLQGTSYILPVDKNCTPSGVRTTLNKITLLLDAIKKRGTYDQLLILDTDALMYDFNVDVTTLLPDQYMLAAHRVKAKTDPVHTHDINAGVLLWNLKHNLTRKGAHEWDSRSRRDVELERSKGDQQPLHLTLAKGPGTSQVWSLVDEFAYGHATIIKHVIRRVGHRSWTDPMILGEREERLKNFGDDVCGKEAGVCDGIEHVAYGTY